MNEAFEYIEKQRKIKLDDFQKEAINYIFQGFDVLVSAPTGSGKTLIAEVRIQDILKRGGRSWYASPIKALSNDKYREFKKLFGTENVGIMTGDRKENTKAPILVGTTEIFRNIIIEEGLVKEPDVDFIVLDEAHWIADKERGVVWEEMIIFAPKKAQLLLLSATFPNIEEIALWISKTRQKDVKVVFKFERPVPLIWFSLGRRIKPLFKTEVSSSLKIEPEEIIENQSDFSVPRALVKLKEKGATPSIIFFSSRKECEEYALQVGEMVDEGKINLDDSDQDRERRQEFCEIYFQNFPYLHNDPFVLNFIKTGVAPHHAGLFPAMKVLFEDALKIGLAHSIFATKTLASGIDVPAKSVVIASKYTFDGERERLLLPSEVLQMTGRAGRRGKDAVGYVFIAAPCGQEIKKFFGDIEPIRSSFYITPHLVLNLLKSLDIPKCLELIRKSLKFFEISNSVEKWEKEKEGVKAKKDQLISEFQKIKPQEKRCSPKTKIDFLNTQKNLYQGEKTIEELKARVSILEKLLNSIKGENSMDGNLVRFLVNKKGKLILLEDWGGFGNSDDGKKKKKFKFEFFVSLGNDERKFTKEKILPLFTDKKFFDKENLLQAIQSLISRSEKLVLQIREENKRRIEEISRFPCVSCQAFDVCSEISKNLKELDDKLNQMLKDNPDEVEKEFRRTIEFLKFMGYLDQDYMLTEKGWEASNLKTPRSIYIYELLKKGLFGNDPAIFAAILAMLLGEPKPPFVKPPQHIEREVEKIYQLELKFGITPKFKPAELVVRKWWMKYTTLAFLDGKIYSAMKIWAKGGDIHNVQEKSGIEVGDLARMVSQTVEVLRQIEKIYEFSYISQVAISKIYRSPITDFVD
jgi:ATP-dependent RNA helicase HelY